TDLRDRDAAPGADLAHAPAGRRRRRPDDPIGPRRLRQDRGDARQSDGLGRARDPDRRRPRRNARRGRGGRGPPSEGLPRRRARGGRRRRTGWGAAAAAAGVGAFTYWLLHGSVDWLWEFPALGAGAFALLGLAAGLAPRRPADPRHLARPLVRGLVPAVAVVALALALAL